MKKILIFAANPSNTDRLRLDQEIREIEDVTKHSEHQIIPRLATRVKDLQQTLLEYRPKVVHFSGHGGGSQGLALENEQGQMQLVSTAALTNLFHLFQNDIECVVLNACYSEEQATAIHQHIDCVVGMNQAIGDVAAINFARGFYGALAMQKAYKEAFAFGCNAIDLQGIPESLTPVIKNRPTLKDKSVSTVAEPKQLSVQSTESDARKISMTAGNNSNVLYIEHGGNFDFSRRTES